MNTAVLGAGSWGTALAIQLTRGENRVRLWDHDAPRAAAMQAARENRRYLPGVHLPDEIEISGDMGAVLEGAEVVVAVVPAQVMRPVMAQAAALLPEGAVVCCASKGVEQGTLLAMDGVLADVLPEPFHHGLCALGGPSFAKEVAEGMPTAVVVASHDIDASHRVASAFHAGFFRVYHTDDVVGVELGGALKNVIAIATGVADGMGLGLNARAAIITRGLAELTRVSVARGAKEATLAGLAGVGDLVLTCTGDLSRNRRVGLGLGQGKTLARILEELGQVAEGVTTAASAWDLAQRAGVQMPITEQCYRMLYEDKPAADAMRDLLLRERKAERG